MQLLIIRTDIMDFNFVWLRCPPLFKWWVNLCSEFPQYNYIQSLSHEPHEKEATSVELCLRTNNHRLGKVQADMCSYLTHLTTTPLT